MDEQDSGLLPRSISPSPPNSRQRSSILPDLNLQQPMRKTFSTRFSIKVRRNKTKQPRPSKNLSMIAESHQTQDDIRTERIQHRPRITAQSWVVMGGKKGKILDGKDVDNPREIASLTKIMTCFVVLNELNSHKKDLDEKIIVSKNAASMQGTSALLAAGDEATIRDLLHGLMLPSGNDAAVALAEFVGNLLSPSSLDPVGAFVTKMNETCKLYKLTSTCFSNPHGMSTSINLSTAKNISTLASIVCTNEQFMRIVNTQSYRCVLRNTKGNREIEWNNTNKLLKLGFSGVKTGFTPNAGPCLCSIAEKRKRKIIIVLLNSATPGSRWSESTNLLKWASKYF
ncbi:unnamed protein product [Blepharisma stoltei]|uniref:Peptidase S11 D-alanyl-D-alanine carboxypeptidase A N-terminal domain-containing protein n=1 Tax=Blepharisma stoltei TaxID=1481888 RepID=A0AAU9JH79_9CILI|nr:unnamed protein product [Blepharisma stoltei]